MAKTTGTGKKYQQVQSIYDSNGSPFKPSPHKAPQYRITELKNQILKVQNNTELTKQRIEDIDIKYKKINNNTKFLN